MGGSEGVLSRYGAESADVADLFLTRVSLVTDILDKFVFDATDARMSLDATDSE